MPNAIYFQIPLITQGQVSTIMSDLDPSKAIGIDWTENIKTNWTNVISKHSCPRK